MHSATGQPDRVQYIQLDGKPCDWTDWTTGVIPIASKVTITPVSSEPKHCIISFSNLTELLFYIWQNNFDLVTFYEAFIHEDS